MANQFWKTEEFKSKTLGEQREIIRQKAAEERAAKEAAAARAKAEKQAYSKMGYYTSSFTQTERGTEQVTKYQGSSKPSGSVQSIYESGGQVVSVSGTRNVYEGGSPSLQEIAPDSQRKQTLRPTVQADTRQQLKIATSPLTPRYVSQQLINELSPAEQRVQQKRVDPNKYGATSIEKADTGLISKGKFLLSNANLKVSNFFKQFKSKDANTGKQDYVIGGTEWIAPELQRSQEREAQIRLKLEEVTGFRKGLLKFQLFQEKSSQFMLGAEKGARERVREKPVSVAGEFAISAGLTSGFSAGKLAVVKTAGFIPVFQKAAPAAKVAGKVGQYGLLTLYGGSVAYNIGTAEGGAFGKGQATGKEVVRAAAFAGGMKFGSGIIKPIEYQTRFELGLQKLPKARQTAARQEFRNLKSLLRDIPRYSQEPSSIEFGKIERLRGDKKAIATVENFFKGRRDVVIGGSVAQRTQVPKSGRIKLKAPSDIDIYTDNPYLIKELAGTLKSAGVGKVYLRGQKIFFGGTGKGFKAIEAHGLTTKGSKMFGMGEKNIFQETVGTVKSPFKPFSDVIKQTPEGIYVQNIKYQAARKLYGGFEVSVDKLGRARLDRYTKDIPNLMQLGEAVGVAPRARASPSFNLNNIFVGKKAMISFGTFDSGISTGKIKISTGNRGGYSMTEYGNYYNSFKAPAGFYPKPSYGSYKPQKPSGSFYPVVDIPKPQAGAYPTRTPRKTTYPVVTTIDRPYRVTIPTEPRYPSIPTYPAAPLPPEKPAGGIIPSFDKPSREFDVGVIPQGKAKSRKKDPFTPDINIDNPFNPKYFASIEASVLNIKGVVPKEKSLMTGLGLRPIKF